MMTPPRATRREWENAVDFLAMAKALTPRERRLVAWLAREETTEEEREKAAEKAKEEA